MTVLWQTEGRRQKRDRRYQVRARRRGSNPRFLDWVTYHRTRPMAAVSAALLAAVGYRVEVWDTRA